MYLFFDTETTGLPISWSAPTSATRNWPRMVQLAALLYQPDGTLVETQNFIIKPDGYTIPSDVAKIHGITTERANKEGTDLQNVLSSFQALTTNANALVAHNMEFDEKILGCEFIRTVGHDPLPPKQKFCTMKSPAVIRFCALPPFNYGSYKWPKLSELHYKLFGTIFNDAHDASVDIQVTARCFFELKKRNII